jgi:hypothetical protein
MHTKDILAAALTDAGLPDMAKRAAAGFYHDFLSPLDTPSIVLANDLQKAGTPAALALLKRHLNGDFDATRDESERWAGSAEGLETFDQLNRAERRKQGQRGQRPKPPERLGDAPIQAEYHEQMNALAAGIDEIFNGDTKGPDRKTGFVLLVFPFGDAEGGRTNFISNGADRQDIVALFKEMIGRFEGQAESEGGHG